MSPWARWRGVAGLVRDAVEHGSRAVERIQVENARRTFTILERIPPVAGAARFVHLAHDTSVETVHSAIRAVNSVVGATVAVVLQEVERRTGDPTAEVSPRGRDGAVA